MEGTRIAFKGMFFHLLPRLLKPRRKASLPRAAGILLQMSKATAAHSLALRIVRAFVSINSFTPKQNLAILSMKPIRAVGS